VEKETNRKSLVGVVYQERDWEIIRWLLEMRFSSINVIQERFVAGNSKDSAGARKRVSKLVKHGLIRPTIGFDGTTRSYYLTTKKGFELLKRQRPSELFPSPLSEISAHTFEHDRRIIVCRLLLEKQGRATNWQSERYLKFWLAARSMELSRDSMPDGIFENRHGINTAFELEYSPKTLVRYTEKIQRLMEQMQSPNALFKMCLIVVSTEFGHRVLTNLTKPYGNVFQIHKWENFVS
jgi:DNA-binding PadR family transcriptional regulator